MSAALAALASEEATKLAELRALPAALEVIDDASRVALETSKETEVRKEDLAANLKDSAQVAILEMDAELSCAWDVVAGAMARTSGLERHMMKIVLAGRRRAYLSGTIVLKGTISEQ